MTDLEPAGPGDIGEWTDDRTALVKATVAPDTTDDELALFLYVAQSRGLDPLNREIHTVVRGRGDRRRMTIQVGIDGYRKIADRTGLVEWVDGPQWSADGVTWVDAWVSDDPPAAARFTVKRTDRTKPETRPATWAEYAQRDRDGNLQAMWANLGPTMLGKVAETHALRAAFPRALGGLYTDDEMQQADTPIVVTPQTAPATAKHSREFVLSELTAEANRLDEKWATTVDLEKIADWVVSHPAVANSEQPSDGQALDTALGALRTRFADRDMPVTSEDVSPAVLYGKVQAWVDGDDARDAAVHDWLTERGVQMMSSLDAEGRVALDVQLDAWMEEGR